ncbi:MAG: cation:proton antiporter [Sulfolobales archaeon]
MYALVTLVLLSLGVVFALIMRRVNMPEVSGYIAGGFVAAFLMTHLSVDVVEATKFIDPLKWFGLILFVFEVSASLEFKKLSKAVNKALAVEILSYVTIWLLSSVIALLFDMDTLSRLAIFMMMINSSTAAIATIRSKGPTSSQGFLEGLATNAVVQTSLEDFVQFMLFTVFMSMGFVLVHPAEALWLILGLVATASLFVLASRFVLKPILTSPLAQEKESKFFLSITIAILFATLARFVGLPELFGAFIGGVVFAYFHSVSDISDLLKGPRDVGLLLYFTSLGLQLYLDITTGVAEPLIIGLGLLIGLTATAARMVGIFLGCGLSGVGLRNSIILALLLSPLSEMGIILTDSLATTGVVARDMVSVSVISVVVSLIFFSLAFPNGLKMLDRIESAIPRKVVVLFETLSERYVKRVEFTVALLSPIVKFSIVLLAVSYLNTISVDLIRPLGLPSYVDVIIGVVSMIVISVALALTLRKIYRIVLTSALRRIRSLRELVSRLLDIVIGGLATTFQIIIVFETIIRLEVLESIYELSAIIISIAIVLTTVYEIHRYLKRSAAPT